MAPSVTLIHIVRGVKHVQNHGFTYKHKDEYCTGSLLSRQVVITASHCIRDKSSFILMVNFLEKKRLLLFRTVKKYHIIRQQSNEEVALLLLNKPIKICERSHPQHERIGIVKLPMIGNTYYHWTDNDIKSTECTMFGYGKHESLILPHLQQNKIDFRLRSMQLNLTTSTTLITNLTSTQKICAGDSGGPVICNRDGTPYLIGIATTVISSRTSKIPQLCRFRTSNGEHAVITGAKFYDVRRGVSQILRFLNVHGQINNMLNDYRKCFNEVYRK